MQDFIDLTGASGARYRFRVCPDGATNDLSRARAERAKVARPDATQVFTRLNVARAQRTAEHEDLVAGYPSAGVIEGVS